MTNEHQPRHIVGRVAGYVEERLRVGQVEFIGVVDVAAVLRGQGNQFGRRRRAPGGRGHEEIGRQVVLDQQLLSLIHI